VSSQYAGGIESKHKTLDISSPGRYIVGSKEGKFMAWKEEVANLPRLAPQKFDIDLETTALLIVDMQYSSASREHGWGPSLGKDFPENWGYYFNRVEQLVIPNSLRLLNAFRQANARVIHLTLGPVLADQTDMTPDRRATGGTLQTLSSNVGTFEHSILKELEPLDTELVINKTSRGAFNSSAIDQMLRNFCVRSLVLAGVSTSACVETTARDAADRGYRTIMVEDACAELDAASHDATLRQFAMRWGRVWTSDQVISELRLPTLT
jgi:nicotinamidase-related amidase